MRFYPFCPLLAPPGFACSALTIQQQGAGDSVSTSVVRLFLFFFKT
ncbi:hypothetical protein HMPREF0880_02432 [Yokenella regensburgei ATCC 43003]|nr:hypothetical protein HMPREF0880_02432 [Yokenella regensburgei ATCC 43003]